MRAARGGVDSWSSLYEQAPADPLKNDMRPSAWYHRRYPMDVRCEKCGTEYELDEARLKPTGVTVKCTNCGHMFKIRRRPTTNVSTPPVAGTSERVWMIRLENGESKTCRELGTLQQWIVAGLVTRDSMISRSGKTWKKLGDIPELASFFAAAAGVEISRAAASQSIPVELTAEPKLVGEPKSVLKTDPKAPNNAATMIGLGVSAVPSADASYPDTAPNPAGGSGALPLPSRDDSKVRNLTVPATAEDYASIQDVPHTASGLLRRPTTQPPPPPGARRPATQPPPPPPGRGDSAVAKLPVPQRSTAAWASDAIKQVNQHHDHDDDAGPSSGSLRAAGPDPKFSGSLRSGPSRDASFSGAPSFRIPTASDSSDDAGASMQLAPARGSRAGLWIALVSLLVIGGAAAAVYVLVFRAPSKSTAPAPVVAAVAIDANLAPTPAIDAGVAPSTPPTDPLAKSRAAILEGVTSRLHAAEQTLSSRPEGGAVSALRARIGLALAQSLDNQATLLAATDKTKADLVARDAKQQVLDIVKLAQHALKDAPTDPQANLAMADILRMQGKPSKDINKYLDAATAGGAQDAANVAREVALIRAMTDLRDGKHDLALTELGNLDGADGSPNGLEKTGDVRPRLQRALVLLTDGKRDDAQTLIQSILATVPDHDIARAAAERIEALVASNPTPSPAANTPTVTPIAVPPPVAGTPVANTPAVAGTPVAAAPQISGDDYNKLITKGNELAEISCGQAMPYFEKALAANPAGIEALTGMGFCHIDAKQFASAYSKFRAALAISPHYERALWGTAEAYQQQGLKDQAIEAYRTYLAAFPGSAAAKKQLDRLGANDGGNAAPPTPTPPTVAPTTPAGTPVQNSIDAPPVAAPPPVATPPKPAADSDSPKSDPQ